MKEERKEVGRKEEGGKGEKEASYLARQLAKRNRENKGEGKNETRPI